MVEDNVEVLNIFKTCPKCKKEIPLGIVICWNCGKCLDERLSELYDGKNS